MVDLSKRKTIKLISGAGTAAVGGMALSGAATAAAIGTTHRGGAVDSQSISSKRLKIQIITGRSAPEDTVIFINNTDADITINEFLPGFVTHNDQMLDMSSLLQEGEVTVKPGYPLASKASHWEPLSLESTKSYLWCDSAVSPLSGDTDTGVINIDTSVINGRAMLTAEHDQIAFS